MNFHSIVQQTKRLPALAALLGIAGTLAAQNANITAHDAWVRLPPPSRNVTAVFMVIENSGSQRRSVVAASSDAAEKVEMHEMTMTKPAGDKQGGVPDTGKSMMVMKPVAEIAIPAKGKATLAPGGLHIMMFGLKSKLADGDKVNVTLKLDDGSILPVTATVREQKME